METMKILPVVFAILLAVACSHALLNAQAQDSAEGFVAGFVPQNQTFKVTWFDALNATYAKVSFSSGQELLFFATSAQNGTYRVSLATDAAQIRGALLERARQDGYVQFNDSAAKAIPVLLDAFNASRSQERMCKQYTGNLDNVCNDRASCQKQCYGVTSLCGPVAQGAGFDFIDRIVEYNNQTAELDSQIASDAALEAALESNTTLVSVDAYLDHLSRIFVLSSKLYRTPLKTDYAFCPTPDYDISKLIVQRDRLVAAKEGSLEVLGAQDESAHMAQAASIVVGQNNGKAPSTIISQIPPQYALAFACAQKTGFAPLELVYLQEIRLASCMVG